MQTPPSRTGFARAVEPVAAATIMTGAEGLDAGGMRIPTADGVIPGYYARPAAYTSTSKMSAWRLARQGYFAVAPALYVRHGDVSELADIPEILKAFAKVPDAQVMSDLDAAVAWAAGNCHADGGRLAITGF
jgi:carboxymethylenebutenolidase